MEGVMMRGCQCSCAGFFLLISSDYLLSVRNCGWRWTVGVLFRLFPLTGYGLFRVQGHGRLGIRPEKQEGWNRNNDVNDGEDRIADAKIINNAPHEESKEQEAQEYDVHPFH